MQIYNKHENQHFSDPEDYLGIWFGHYFKKSLD